MTLEAPMVLNIISHKNWLLLPRSWVTHLETRPTGLKTKTIWNGAKPFKVIDPENEFFLVQFSTMNDYLHVLVDGPWTILGPGQNFEASITWTHYKDVFLGAFSLPFQLIEKTEDLDQEMSHEGLPQVCYTYGQVGHNSILCSFSKFLRNQPVKPMIESTGLGLSAQRDIYIW
ncbi:hypothetical protein OIU85_012555 [Salix viminalis]|uniref:DUF4283 domain-containing protein n=1 Tax=Salix viminalis TaxID=40686 RepID=A0A9Q0NPN0_SALVM|nr:hypothetical protein OIU85_012555 [Salix viminalis]